MPSGSSGIAAAVRANTSASTGWAPTLEPASNRSHRNQKNFAGSSRLNPKHLDPEPGMQQSQDASPACYSSARLATSHSYFKELLMTARSIRRALERKQKKLARKAERQNLLLETAAA